VRVQLPVGPLFCVVNDPTRGRPWSAAAARSELRQLAREAGVRRRFAPHQLRHAHAVEMAREGVPLIVMQRQLGHTNLGITSVYLQGIDNAEIIDTVHARRAPMIPVDSSLASDPSRRPAAEARSLSRRSSSSGSQPLGLPDSQRCSLQAEAAARPRLRHTPMRVSRRMECSAAVWSTPTRTAAAPL
jgi:integrase/recombinase XerD